MKAEKAPEVSYEPFDARHENGDLILICRDMAGKDIDVRLDLESDLARTAIAEALDDTLKYWDDYDNEDEETDEAE